MKIQQILRWTFDDNPSKKYNKGMYEQQVLSKFQSLKTNVANNWNLHRKNLVKKVEETKNKIEYIQKYVYLAVFPVTLTWGIRWILTLRPAPDTRNEYM